MSTATPAPGTTRYLCPLECGWYHDVPPPSVERAAELRVTADPAARDLSEAIASVAHQACLTEAQQTERAFRQHLSTHTPQQFVRVIHDLRVEIAELKTSSEETSG